MSKTGTPEAYRRHIEENAAAELRRAADAADAGDKTHWATVMRIGAAKLDAVTAELSAIKAKAGNSI